MPDPIIVWRQSRRLMLWIALGACGPIHTPQSGAVYQWELIDCPTHWERLPKRLGGRVPPGGFALPKQITDVPEFNDCQRLLVDEGQAFGPMVAVFASVDLFRHDSRYDTSSVTPPDTAIAAGLILNLDLEIYGPLRIRPGFSCLYLWPDTGTLASRPWHATIMWVDTAQSRCAAPMAVESLPPSNLVVHRWPSQDPAAAFPPVARWDWSPQSRQHSIVIACGRAFCEIGAPGFVPRQPYRSVAGPGPWEMRHKGWYDDQLLAVPDGQGGLRPSDVRGIVFPIGGSVQISSLERRAMNPNVIARWDTVAFISIDRESPYYKRMLNLNPVAGDASFEAMNMLSFCKGTRSTCGVPAPPTAAQLASLAPNAPRLAPMEGCDQGSESVIWVRITPAGSAPGGEDDMYRCVKRTGHDFQSPEIPATARWRWMISDETVWRECTKGCCQIVADG